MRRCLKGLGGFPTSTDGFILGPSHGIAGRLDFCWCELVVWDGRIRPSELLTLLRINPAQNPTYRTC